MKKNTAVLLMAYGTPRTLDEVEGYYVDIRGGRHPSPELLDQLKKRYETIGGKTPLLEITQEQASKVSQKTGLQTYVGMKHWHPFIKEAVTRMRADGVKKCIALTLAPHYSAMSTGGYKQRLESARAELAPDLDIKYIDRWGANPLYIRSIVERMQDALARYDLSDAKDVMVVFTAHSLPEKILSAGDPYKDELLETSRLVVESSRIPHSRFAFQSAGHTSDPWLGPDILASLEAIKHDGFTKVLIVPIGFVTDNLEILYDVDIEAARKAEELGLKLYRTSSANATSRFIEALVDSITSAL